MEMCSDILIEVGTPLKFQRKTLTGTVGWWVSYCLAKILTHYAVHAYITSTFDNTFVIFLQ